MYSSYITLRPELKVHVKENANSGNPELGSHSDLTYFSEYLGQIQFS